MESTTISLMELGKMMHAIYKVFRKRSESLMNEEIRISVEQLSLLHAISMKPEDVIQKDMAEMMRKDKSAILRLIDSLEEKGLVRRVSDLKDRRKNCLLVTKAGNRTLEQYMQVVHEMVKELAAGIAPADIDTFRKVSVQIKNNADNL